MKLKHKFVIFDLDGTLVDTLVDIAAAMNRALAGRGYGELKVEDYHDKVGWGIKRLAYLCLPTEARNEENAALVSDDAATFYAQTPVLHSQVYPGILDLVASLRQKKVKTAVLTNKPNPVALKVIAGLFPPQSFDSVNGEISGAPRKPDPACVWELLVEFGFTPSDAIIMGDSEVDMQTAVAAGCYPLGVGWGYRSRDIIVQAGARRIIEKPEELLELI